MPDRLRINAEEVDRTLEYFIVMPSGDPSDKLNCIAAVVAEEACDRDNCITSAAQNPRDVFLSTRLVGCYTCSKDMIICNTFGTPKDPDIIEVDTHIFLRKKPFEAVQEFYTVIDSVSTPKDLWDRSVREKIAETIQENY